MVVEVFVPTIAPRILLTRILCHDDGCLITGISGGLITSIRGGVNTEPFVAPPSKPPSSNEVDPEAESAPKSTVEDEAVVLVL